MIGHFVVVAALVEHAADHMHPRTTRIALHPPLLLLVVIHPLLQLTLAHLQLQQKHKAWANSSPWDLYWGSSQAGMRYICPRLVICTAAMQSKRRACQPIAGWCSAECTLSYQAKCCARSCRRYHVQLASCAQHIGNSPVVNCQAVNLSCQNRLSDCCLAPRMPVRFHLRYGCTFFSARRQSKAPVSGGLRLCHPAQCAPRGGPDSKDGTRSPSPPSCSQAWCSTPAESDPPLKANLLL